MLAFALRSEYKLWLEALVYNAKSSRIIGQRLQQGYLYLRNTALPDQWARRWFVAAPLQKARSSLTLKLA